MDHEITVDIDAPAAGVWEVVADVERWPQWSPSMQSVTWVGDRGLEVGSVAQVKQPGLPAARWVVTQVEEGTAFVWRTAAVGLWTDALHRIVPVSEEAARVTLAIHQHGLLAPVVAPLLARRIRAMVEAEAAGLKRRCEVAAR